MKPIKIKFPAIQISTFQDVAQNYFEFLTMKPPRMSAPDIKNRKIEVSILYGLYVLFFEKNQKIQKPRNYNITLEVHQVIIFLDALHFYLKNTSNQFTLNHAEILKNKLDQQLKNQEPISSQPV